MDNFNILPEDVISEILPRLPAESVLECKLVSKTWRNLIHHPLFSKMHTSHSAAAYTNDSGSGKLGFLALAKNQQLYYFEYIENHETPIDRIRHINLTPPIKYRRFTYVGSCNGLICIRAMKESCYIYNPMTKEYVALPEPKINFRRVKDRWIGFGYLPSNNEYTVVLMYKVPKFVEVMVYTLGSGNGWRNIGKFHLKLGKIYDHGIFVTGSLNWMDRSRRKILVFDLADEKFREHLLPPPLPTLPTWTLHSARNLKLLALGGFLCCALDVYFGINVNPQCSAVWLYKKKNDNDDMKEQDEHQSLGWTKVFTSAYSTPLALTKNGGVLGYISSYCDAGYGSTYFDIYDPKTLTLSKELFDFKEHFGFS